RHLISGTERIRAAGYVPQVNLEDGLGRYLDWLRLQSDVRDYFSEAAEILRNKGIVHRVTASCLGRKLFWRISGATGRGAPESYRQAHDCDCSSTSIASNRS